MRSTLCQYLAPVVRRLDNAIHWINLYPLNNAIRFAITNPLDSIICPIYDWTLADCDSSVG